MFWLLLWPRPRIQRKVDIGMAKLTKSLKTSIPGMLRNYLTADDCSTA